MRRRLLASVTVLVAVLLLVAVPTVSGKKPGQILDFQSMVGVPRPLTGAPGTIRGIPGAGLPWVVDSAKGDLSADGVLEVKVKGLVIDPNDPQAIAANLAGVNPSATFLAVVSCLAADGTTQQRVQRPVPGDDRARRRRREGRGPADAAPAVHRADRVRDEPGGRAWFAATGG